MTFNCSILYDVLYIILYITIALSTDKDNATILGDPLFEVPLPNPDDYKGDPALESTSFCYEVHGTSDRFFNLISDGCISVNALYKRGVLDPELNFMTKYGIAADGISGQCHTLEFDVDGCKAFVDGFLVTGSSMTDGIHVRKLRNEYKYIVSVPNCGTTRRLMMWILCSNTTRGNHIQIRDNALYFRVLYADGLRPFSHGLLGKSF